MKSQATFKEHCQYPRCDCDRLEEEIMNALDGPDQVCYPKLPLEFETYTCGECGKPVETEWCSDGLLPGSYELLGEVFFHKPGCVDKYLAEFSRACSLPCSQSESPSIQDNCTYGYVLPDRCRYNNLLGCDCGAYPPKK